MIDVDGNGYIDDKELAQLVGIQIGQDKEMIQKLI